MSPLRACELPSPLAQLGVPHAAIETRTTLCGWCGARCTPRIAARLRPLNTPPTQNCPSLSRSPACDHAHLCCSASRGVGAAGSRKKKCAMLEKRQSRCLPAQVGAHFPTLKPWQQDLLRQQVRRSWRRCLAGRAIVGGGQFDNLPAGDRRSCRAKSGPSAVMRRRRGPLTRPASTAGSWPCAAPLVARLHRQLQLPLGVPALWLPWSG